MSIDIPIIIHDILYCSYYLQLGARLFINTINFDSEFGKNNNDFYYFLYYYFFIN